MTNTLQQSILKLRVGAASAALAFVVMLGLGVVTTHSAQAQTFTVLYNFTGTPDGHLPYAGLVRDKAGNPYGTTYVGGSGRCFNGCGTVFKLSKTGKETVLHNFAGAPSDGQLPFFTGLFMDKNGNLYGTTYEGGASNEGVVYKLSKTGTLTLLYSFAGGTTDGCGPNGNPAMDTKGNLYGTTRLCGPSDLGIVWKVSQKGAETVLHSFAGAPSDGEYPWAARSLDLRCPARSRANS